MIHRFSDKFAATSARSLCVPPDVFKQMEIYAVGRRIPSVHRIMESTRGKIMHGRFVRWPPLHSADSPSPYNGPPRRFRPVLLTENRRSLSRMPLQPSVVPSRLSTPSPPRRLSRTRHTGRAFINFCSEQLRKCSKLLCIYFAERKMYNWDSKLFYYIL